MFRNDFLGYILSANNILVSAIVVTAILGDICVTKSKLLLFRAFFDNVTHSIIGGLSWVIVSRNIKHSDNYTIVIDVLLCTFIASAIDADHFLEAGTLDISRATSLDRRPFLHCTTVPFLIAGVLLPLGYFWESPVTRRLAWIQLTAFLSHHTRDATRRGYWIYPLGSTPPTPYMLYILISVIIPFFIVIGMNHSLPYKRIPFDPMQVTLLDV